MLNSTYTVASADLPGLSVGSLWQTHEDYSADLPTASSKAQFLEVSDLLFQRANLNSTHLFRADILFDSAGQFFIVPDNESQMSESSLHLGVGNGFSPPNIEGFELDRTLLRRLIPRKPQLDKPLKQSCYVYSRIKNDDSQASTATLVLYLPHVRSKQEIPWYHPQVRALAYLYEEKEKPYLSVHFLPFDLEEPLPDRLHRTFLSLLQTLVRLMKLPSHPIAPKHDVDVNRCWKGDRSTALSAIRDTILPQHVVQDTYTRLKQIYATDLISRWVEKTEPSKHVFEDLSIAAFLIELWTTMYDKDHFPGFVDIACGNGVLVYILIKEGYDGYGFDARRRKTWDVLNIDDHLQESLCLPQPFLDVLQTTNHDQLANVNIHNGIFKENTFIISNHADELTLWTPILAALSCPKHPLPFLAIPCCSHALSGEKHRYSLNEVLASRLTKSSEDTSNTAVQIGSDDHGLEDGSRSGDLNAMRAAKQKAASHGTDKSMYACLTKKTIALAEEVGFVTEMTLMRIPSTRNIGVVGGRVQNTRPALLQEHPITEEEGTPSMGGLTLGEERGDIAVHQTVNELLERECAKTGGMHASAQTWVARAQKLQVGIGRGKVNLGAAPVVHS